VEENITEEVLDKKINELVASRGRKNTDPREVLRKLEVLSKSARPLGKRGSILKSAAHMHLFSVKGTSASVSAI
jgi:predicted MarR family transcription regulator